MKNIIKIRTVFIHTGLNAPFQSNKHNKSNSNYLLQENPWLFLNNLDSCHLKSANVLNVRGFCFCKHLTCESLVTFAGVGRLVISKNGFSVHNSSSHIFINRLKKSGFTLSSIVIMFPPMTCKIILFVRQTLRKHLSA